MRHLLLIAATAMSCMVFGCGGGDDGPKELTVTGKVTFKGAAIAEGKISFEEPTLGYGASSELGTDGSYSLKIPEGEYKVTITPLVEITGGGEDSPPSEVFKAVDNIPMMYRVAETSGLTAKVSESGLEHSFDMKK